MKTATKRQIRLIRQARLHAVRPVSTEAWLVLHALQELINKTRPTWHVSCEVSMGAFIEASNDSKNVVLGCYNSKRVDFLLIDRFRNPKLAIEYHGSGHNLSDDASERMQVKRLVLESAGIPLVEIPAKATLPEIWSMVTRMLRKASKPRSSCSS